MQNRRRKTAAVALVVTGVLGLGVASAAQLTLTSASLGAGTTVVASCQDDETIDVSFGTELKGGEFQVTTVTLTGLAATCVDQDARIALQDAGGDLLGAELEGTIGTAGSQTFTVADPVPARQVEGVAVVIHG